MDALRNAALIAARVLMAGVFIYDSTLLARFPASNMDYMAAFGLPGILLWPTALFQFGGGLSLVAGLLTRLVAVAFAGFAVATAVIFHTGFADINDINHFGKDLALAGGFLCLAVTGAGAWSADAALAGRRRG